mmetsp:Transcript_34533/g.97848  ORF Transcript_34533/g.97848 Transcript_34533/m.97848 type:complete len:208 (-) Transcript_34533:153-776(-)
MCRGLPAWMPASVQGSKSPQTAQGPSFHCCSRRGRKPPESRKRTPQSTEILGPEAVFYRWRAPWRSASRCPRQSSRGPRSRLRFACSPSQHRLYLHSPQQNCILPSGSSGLDSQKVIPPAPCHADSSTSGGWQNGGRLGVQRWRRERSAASWRCAAEQCRPQSAVMPPEGRVGRWASSSYVQQLRSLAPGPLQTLGQGVEAPILPAS